VKWRWWSDVFVMALVHRCFQLCQSDIACSVDGAGGEGESGIDSL
jgi:hypothetical protein